MIKLSQKDLKDKENFFYSYMGMKKNNASLSEVDPNANVNNKNIATLGAEYNKDINVQVNRYILGERIEKLFGAELKQEYYRQLENYEIYSHDESTPGIRPYCVAIDLYPFINGGNISIGGSSKKPNNLQSFCGIYVNLIFLIASQFAGAVADVSFLTYFDYFARKDYGDDYLNTHKKEIENFFQQVIYTLNDPSVGRGNQAVFYNTSIFDKYYFESLFSKTVFPNFTNPKWESVNKLQKFFMSWFNQERTRAVLTFPVITAAGLLDENGIIKDLEFKEFITKEMSEGNSFFIYTSDTADSLASCCFNGDERIVLIENETRNKINISIKEFVNFYINVGETKIIEKYSIESFNFKTSTVEISKISGVLAKKNEYNKLIEITVGNKSIKVTPDHLFCVKNKETGELEEIVAGEILKNKNKYLIPVESLTSC